MLHESVTVGPFQCNCHILADETTREAVLIDPGDEADAILEVVRANRLVVKALVHTHAHLDHITGTRKVHEEVGGSILVHADDRPLYDRLAEQARAFGWKAAPPAAPDGELAEASPVCFGPHELRVLHTPGHTPGSCSFYIAGERPALFSGDTLFAGSIGRTDLWGGDFDTEIRSIRTKLLALDDDLVVYPGHGPSTRIGSERATNPFLV